MLPRRLHAVDDLTRPDVLRSVLNCTETIRVEPLQTLGYSGSCFFRIVLDERPTYLVKQTVLADDWFSHRTRDAVGREAAALLDPALTAMHQVFSLPYRAVAREPGQFAVLMDDVSTGLFPDVRMPLDRGDENVILDALARLHAAFWASPDLNALAWLHQPADFLYLMGPHDHTTSEPMGGSARNIQTAVRDGWATTLDLLPQVVRRAILRPPQTIAASWANLPLTLVHGDTKVANFALMPGRNVCALDWAFVGHAPCTFDLGWYLAVNASRLSGSKAQTLATYRQFLEHHLGQTLADSLWADLEEAGIVCGALMLLWTKGTAVAAGRAGAQAEWDWWVDRLTPWAQRIGKS